MQVSLLIFIISDTNSSAMLVSEKFESQLSPTLSYSFAFQKIVGTILIEMKTNRASSIQSDSFSANILFES